MKIGDPVMRVFKHGDNWIGVVTWLNKRERVAEVMWAHGLEDVHHFSILTEVI